MTDTLPFSTIPELYTFLNEVIAKEVSHPMMRQKVDNNWSDISYSDFKEKTELFAYGLASMGVKRGEKIAIISENRPEWIYSDMAILGLGAINVPLYPSLTSDSIEYILNNSESTIIIVSNKFQLNKVLKVRENCKYLKHIIMFNEREGKDTTSEAISFSEICELGKSPRAKNPYTFRENVSMCREDDLATIIYTSGTTGEPKGVMLTHKNIISNVRAARTVLNIRRTDSFLSFLPLCHIFERMAGYYTIMSAGCEFAFAQSIETVPTNLVEIKPTIITAVPRLFERIYSKTMKNVESQSPKKQKIFHWAVRVGLAYMANRRTGDIPLKLKLKFKLADKVIFSKIREKMGGNIRFFISGSAALARDLGEFFEAAGIPIIEGYGLTESSPVIAVNAYEDYKFGTVGRPIPGIDVKIASDGEILVKGPNIMLGYYKNKKETAEVLKDGWLHTGDIGVFDQDGYLMITDRKKHLFKTSGGKYVAPTPIENMFLASKFIDQFILIGDRRMFLSALIVPDYEALKEYADSNRLPYATKEELVKNDQIIDLMEKELIKFQKNLANYERVRKFALLDKPFTLEEGEVTPSLKLRRKVIEERYKHLIDGMYS